MSENDVGYDSLDDAAVYHLKDGRILIQSVDFFTPIVDDPFLFGRIAAVNSLSDIYAMGGYPLFALNVVGFPSDELPMSVLADILKGAQSIAEEVRIPVLGGHTIKDKEPKFGWVVTGECGPGGIIRNSTAKPGDLLVLTKPLGSGIITTAIKKDLAEQSQIDTVVDVMSRLNNSAADAMLKTGVNACTDVTGYGFLGHLLEMCSGSQVSAEIKFANVPFLPGVSALAAKGIVPGGTKKNLKFVQPKVSFGPLITEQQQLMLADAQTSGGLLISVAEGRLERLLTELNNRHTLASSVVGKITKQNNKSITIV